MEQQYDNYFADLTLLGDYLEEGTFQGWSHPLRKNILLLLHKLKTNCHKSGNINLANELVALEVSLGFGDGNDFNPEKTKIADHQIRILELIDDSDETEIEQPEAEQPEIEEIVIEYEAIDDDQLNDLNIITDEEKVLNKIADPDKSEAVTQAETTTEEKTTKQGIIQLVMCNCPGRDAARELARHLIEARLAACINIIANIGSIYWWKGEIHDTAECQLQIKTSHQSLNDVIDYIKQYHPDEVPDILVIPIDLGNMEYFEWVKQETYDRE